MVRGLSQRPNLAEGPAATWDLWRSIEEEEEEEDLPEWQSWERARLPTSLAPCFAPPDFWRRFAEKGANAVMKQDEMIALRLGKDSVSVFVKLFHYIPIPWRDLIWRPISSNVPCTGRIFAFWGSINFGHFLKIIKVDLIWGTGIGLLYDWTLLSHGSAMPLLENQF
jgi:hypothetical protein